MSAYTPEKFLLPNGLDEIGLRIGLYRLKYEDLSTYRKRLLAEIRDPAGADQESFIRSLNRQVGEFDVPVFEIGLVLDAFGDPIILDPHIEVTSSYINVYTDYANRLLDFSLNIVDRDGGYFLRSVYNAFAASINYTITMIDTDYQFKRSDHLRYGTSEKLVLSETLLNSCCHNLDGMYIKDITTQARDVFRTEQATQAAIAEDGDYYIDYSQGVLFTHIPMKGFTTYTYEDFPFTLYWQPVKAYPLNDDDTGYWHLDPQVSDITGSEDEYIVLNSEGSKIINQALAIHSLEWGE